MTCTHTKHCSRPWHAWMHRHIGAHVLCFLPRLHPIIFSLCQRHYHTRHYTHTYISYSQSWLTYTCIKQYVLLSSVSQCPPFWSTPHRLALGSSGHRTRGQRPTRRAEPVDGQAKGHHLGLGRTLAAAGEGWYTPGWGRVRVHGAEEWCWWVNFGLRWTGGWFKVCEHLEWDTRARMCSLTHLLNHDLSLTYLHNHHQ